MLQTPNNDADLLKKLKEMEEIQKNTQTSYPFPPYSPPPGCCPHCGCCPTCGRGGWYGNWPYYPTITWTAEVSCGTTI